MRFALSLSIVLVACRGSDAPVNAAIDAQPPPALSPSPSFVPSSPPPASASAKPAANDAAPPALACIAKLYTGRALKEGSAWLLELPDGSKLPWDDGKTKDMAARIEAPDIEDVFAVPYRAGPIEPIRDPEHDPGRARVEPLFRATYGATPSDVEKNLVPVRFVGHTVRIHRLVAEALKRVDDRLSKIIEKDSSLERYFKTLGGTFNARAIAGTDRASAHSWGIAIDIDVSLSDYWRNVKPIVWVNRVPQSIVDAFEAERFVWGGRWFHFDTMHFEFRPELFDPSCRSSMPK